MSLTNRLTSRPSHARRRVHAAGRAAALAGALALLVAPAADALTAPVTGWGRRGPLGLDGTTTDVFVTPTPILEAAAATAAAVGPAASFVLTPAGVLAAGGGFLGLPDSPTPYRFTSIPGTVGAKAVATGADATLIAQADGSVLAFGRNRYGAAGATPAETVAGAVSLPVAVAGLGDVATVAVGARHALALKADGSVWAWGDNVALGSVSAVAGADSGTPQRVALPNGLKATAIAAGEESSLALLEDGSVWGWGRNDYGQIGDGTTTPVIAEPVRVIAPPAAGVKRVRSISAGGWAGYALYDDGSYAAWGYNGLGELGLGNGAQDVLVPTEPAPALKAARPDRYPRLTQISAVGETTFAIAAAGGSGVAGRVLAWGDGSEAQFGFGDGTAAYDFAFPYTGAPGTAGQQATEIPQRVGRLKQVPWLGVGSSARVQIAPTDPTLRPAAEDTLPFFSHPVGTVSARGRAVFKSSGDPTTVSKIKIVGRDAGDFEIAGYNTSGDVSDAASLPLAVSADAGSLFVYVRFYPSAAGERVATLQVSGDGETSSIALSGFGADLPGNTPGERGSAARTARPARPARRVSPAPPASRGAAGRNGVVTFAAKASSTKVRRGRTAALRFTLVNATSGRLAKTSASVSAPKALRAKASKAVAVKALAAGTPRDGDGAAEGRCRREARQAPRHGAAQGRLEDADARRHGAGRPLKPTKSVDKVVLFFELHSHPRDQELFPCRVSQPDSPRSSRSRTPSTRSSRAPSRPASSCWGWRPWCWGCRG